MKTYFTLKTIDPIIVSKSTATTTNHQGLDYIPGSAILGSIASSLYSQLDEEESWKVFHNGHVQFGPCYPVENEELCLPTPASWHHDKLIQAVENNRYQADSITNHANHLFLRDKETQYKQCRNGYINSQGDAANVSRGITTKTALNRSKGIVEQSALFSYSFIDSGQTFLGWISCDCEILRKKVESHLYGIKHIGRSKNTEFGRVKVEKLQTQPQVKSVPSSVENTLTLWCLSDCQCIDHLGLPTLSPALEDLVEGASGVLDFQRTFIRYDSASRFNQTRGGLDSEQMLISKGSVLVYRDISINEQQLQQIATKGIGINKHQGLGWVYINPDWSQSDTLSLAQLFSPIEIPRSITVQDTGTAPSSPLTNWIHAKVELQQAQRDVQNQANVLAQKLIIAYDKARTYNTIPQPHLAGPSKTQWGRVRDVLRYEVEDWQDKLFVGNQAICKSKNDPIGWGIQWHSPEGPVSFSDQCQKDWQDIDAKTLLQALELLSHFDLSTSHDLNKVKSRFKVKDNLSEQGVGA